MDGRIQSNELAGIKSFLDQKVLEFNRAAFIQDDPVSLPHLFRDRRDIEISAFLTATIAWGNRKSILSSAHRILDLMDHHPFDFVSEANNADFKRMSTFVHRTFNGTDLVSFIKCLQCLYKEVESMEVFFADLMNEDGNSIRAITHFRDRFFSYGITERSRKHVSDPSSGSAAKRLNMFLRWMVRNDSNGVDFGIWSNIPKSALSIPLDVHSGNIARKLGLLHRKQNDITAVNELDSVLRIFDPLDPVKYDYALFGLGAIEKF